jgi:hypothetical protein
MRTLMLSPYLPWPGAGVEQTQRLEENSFFSPPDDAGIRETAPLEVVGYIIWDSQEG